HGEILGQTGKGRVVFDFAGIAELYDHADLALHVGIGFGQFVGAHCFQGDAADGDVLSDLGDYRCVRFGDGGAVHGQALHAFDVGNLFLRYGFGDFGGEAAEIVGSGNEVGFAIDFHGGDGVRTRGEDDF